MFTHLKCIELEANIINTCMYVNANDSELAIVCLAWVDHLGFRQLRPTIELLWKNNISNN